MSDNELLVRIDERTTTILERLEDLQARSDRLDKAVFIGNGQPALLERVSTLETQIAQFMVICTECRRVVYGPSPTEKKPDTLGLAEVAKAAIAANADVKKTITVESWKFWAAVVSGLCGLVAAALALLNQLH
jgi:hypothetical protein